MPAIYAHVCRLFRISSFVIIFLALNICFTINVQAAPSISNITDNRNSYTNSQVPKFDKFEITFNIDSTDATNFFFPFDPNPPAGIALGTGISVSAVFTDPESNTFTQPGFYYQNFEDATIGTREWFYPTANYSWKVRFSPNKVGTWKYKITAQDSSGTTQSAETTFSVSDSGNKGFIKVSPRDPRYFEYDDGTYFPALGYNLNGGDLDNVNPVLGNQSKFQAMNANGIELSRVWISQFSIFGEAYGKWGSPNRAHQTQEPRYGIVNPINSILTSTFATYYPGQPPPALPGGSEYYMWLEFNKTPSADGSLQRFTPCRYFATVKQNTNYRVKVRYLTVGLEGPLDSSKPFGFAIKRSASELFDPIDACNDPNTTGVTTIAASYNSSQVQNDSANPDWKFLEGTYNSGANDFFGYLYLTFDNVASTDGDFVAGQVFIDNVWLEEASCNSNCANLVHKPDMDMHLYVNQRDAYSFDKLLDLSKEYEIYLKAVMLEKNDRIFQTIDFNGQPAAKQAIDNFYGNGTTLTKVRWLQQAWWRYMQARWGYSPYIHSWELLNEGGATANHYTQADEFGKYMHCRVFGIEPVVDSTLGNVCQFDHPNSHLVTTSFFGSLYPWQFWNNGGNAASYTLYRDIDYADQHYYANVDDTGALASYYDSALFSYKLSTANNFSAFTRKPFIRGETAWGAPASTYFETNAEGGEWLHDFIWAGINPGGLMEHFFAGGNFTKQIYNLSGNPPHDHRPVFNTFYDFIKDVPLNNGEYEDAAASVSNTDLRAWGQKDLTNKRAHLWIANKNHTWKSVVDGVSVTPISGNITLGGFDPNTSYKFEWWNTYAGTIISTQNISTNSQGNLVLSVNNLVTDTAVKIGDYIVFSPSPTPAGLPGDINGANTVNTLDFTLVYRPDHQ